MKKEEIGKTYYRDLIREVSHRTGLTLPQAQAAVGATFDSIKSFLFNKRSVIIRNFGVFRLLPIKGGIITMPSGQKLYKKDRLKPKFTFKEKLRLQIQTATMDKKPEADLTDYLDLFVNEDQD